MISADADYARIVALLSKQQLAPYVSYAKTDTVKGLGKARDSGRVVVRVSDGTIISGDSSGIQAGDYHGRANPVSHPSFDPACYRATGEEGAELDGRSAIKLTLAPVCRSSGDDNDYPFTTLYADATTLEPLDVYGVIEPSDANKNVRIALDQHYGEFSGRVLPTSLKVDVSGSGWMFWLQVHVTETYADYRFTNSP